MPDYFDPQLEVELRELRRLVKLRKLLEPTAQIFTDKAPKGCHGDCTHPVMFGMGLTCCNLYPIYEYHDTTLRLETMQRQVIEVGRAKHRRACSNPKIEGADLQNEYYRDFTGTSVLRRQKEDEAVDPDDSGTVPIIKRN